ncbi:MAG: DapH/DapD/GlmU-related protein, partial [Fervidobacterium sp.]
GEGTMIDMNVVIGARARIGRYCHIGAGSVIAGVVEPPSASPVIIEDHVLIGANAVVLEGVRIGEHSVIAAGAVVVNDIPPYTVVAGVPAKVVKQVDEKTKSKTQILEELRKIK